MVQPGAGAAAAVGQPGPLLGEAEDQVKLGRANNPVITEDDLLKMCLIFAFKDRNLAEKALAENYDLKTTIQVAVRRESSKSKAKAIQGEGGEAEVKRVKCLGGQKRKKVSAIVSKGGQGEVQNSWRTC